ncbi:MAG: TlpA family protein disulfide reductase [Butyricimonas faecihominis]
MRLKHYLSCMLILLSFVTVNAQEKKELKEGDQAPTFKYLDINGKEVSLSDLKGKYVYIDIWATWCGPCTGELPHLKGWRRKCGKKIVFVSISCDKDKAARRKW